MQISKCTIEVIQGDITELAVDMIAHDIKGKADEKKVRASCKSSLAEADRLKLSSVAFPALGCGTGSFPLVAAAKIMSQEAYRHLRDGRSTLRKVIFCLYDKGSYEVFEKTALAYLRHILDVLQAGPFVTVDAIIEVGDKIVIIERANPPFGWALPGGFVDYGESLEEAVTREAKEETALTLTDLTQFHTYSRPNRDPRFHTIGTVFIAKGKGTPRSGDDAASLKLISQADIERLDFAFDHKEILKDYLTHKKAHQP